MKIKIRNIYRSVSSYTSRFHVRASLDEELSFQDELLFTRYTAYIYPT